MRYNNGIVYIILNDLGQCYVGSTIQSLKIRLQKHLSDHRGHTEPGRKFREYRSSFEVLSGTNYEIYPIEYFPCNNVNELETRETQWILKLINYCNIELHASSSYSPHIQNEIFVVYFQHPRKHHLFVSHILLQNHKIHYHFAELLAHY